MAKTKKKTKKQGRRALAEAMRFDARPDRADFRDKLYEPGLHYVPPRMNLSVWHGHRVPVLDQGPDGACTGFGLATVANFLLGVRLPRRSVSPRMLYETAKRYDEWPGEDYEGSSCKGAVKGWQRHGVCLASLWPHKDGETTLTAERERDAAKRPLGAYYRVNAHNLAHMHAAIAETGILYVSGDVHEGWWEPKNGRIQFPADRAGGHAFVIVGYDSVGFWIQNSWGASWGLKGCALLTYDDWIANGYDAWAVRLGVPMITKGDK